MKTLSPYLNFFGRAREALEFYKNAFNGEIVQVMTFAEGGGACPGGTPNPNDIMHSEFRADGIHFFATDGMPGSEPFNGNRITLTINFTSLDEQAAVFAALAHGGEITQPLVDQFWGAKYGEVTDKFGLLWSLNCFTTPINS
jgi:PhnB protein